MTATASTAPEIRRLSARWPKSARRHAAARFFLGRCTADDAADDMKHLLDTLRYGRRHEGHQQLGSYELVARLGRGGMGEVHRDVKPANIDVCRMGLDYDFIKVLDFGLVKFRERNASASQTLLTIDHTTTGTPATRRRRSSSATPT